MYVIITIITIIITTVIIVILFHKTFDNKIMIIVITIAANSWVESKWPAGYPTSIVLLLINYFPYC